MIDAPALSVLLLSFHEVARNSSISVAADRLNVSQPTVTQRVRQLEELYGVELLHRRGNKISLTDAGGHLMPFLDCMTQSLCAADFQLRNAAALRTGEIRIGATGPYYILSLVAAFRTAHPGVQLHLHIANSHAVIDALTDNKLDLAVSSASITDTRIGRRLLAEEPLVVLMPAGHPLCVETSIDLNNLVKHRLLMRERGSMTRQITEDLFQSEGIKPADIIEIGSREAIQMAVEHGLGCTLLSRGEVPPNTHLVVKPLRGTVPVLCEYLYYLKEREHSHLVSAFLALLETRQQYHSKLPIHA